MRFVLECHSGSSGKRTILLGPRESMRFGRSNADHVFPGDQQMSGVHFVIEHRESGWRARDLKSRNGTFVNSKRIQETMLANGDEIRAGNTVFVFRIVPDVGSSATSAVPVDAPVRVVAPQTGQVPPVPHTPQERLTEMLSREFQPLFALLDAACEPSVLKVIFESKEEYQSLFEGPQGAQLTHFAPYLIRIPPKSPLIDTLVKHAWAKSWGVFLTSDKSLKDLRTHFRQFLMVKLPNGKQVYFRFYDPTVLRLFLPTCLPKEIEEFFGPVKQFLMEAEDPGIALHFARGPKGAEKKERPFAAD